MSPVIFKGQKEKIGQVVKIKVSNINRNTLFGNIVETLKKKVA